MQSRERRLFSLLRRLPARVVAVALLLLGVEFAVGYWAYFRYEADFLVERRAQLDAIAVLESARLAQWLGERVADARILSQDRDFGGRVQDALRDGKPERLDLVRGRLELVRRAYGYSRVTVADASGRIVTSTKERLKALQAEEFQAVAAALAENAPVTSTVHRRNRGRYDLDIAAPLFGPGGERLSVVVLLEISFDNLLQRTGTPRHNADAETGLARIEGDRLVYMDRATPGAAVPAVGPEPVESIAYQAMHGVRGPVDGLDAAGRQVIAAVADVPGTDWLVVTQLGAAQVHAAIRYRGALAVAGFALVLLLIAIAGYQTVLRREAAARLRAQEARARLAAIVEGADDAIVSTDLNGHVVSWNPGAQRLFGYTEREARGRHVRTILPADATEHIESSVARVEAGETVKSADVVRVRKDGSAIRVSVTRSPMLDESGRVIGIARIYRDITEQQRAAAAQQRLAAIVEHSNDAMVTRTLDGIITSWNAGAARMFGYSAEEALGRHVNFLHPPGSAPRLELANERLLCGEAFPPFRGQRVTKDGRTIDVLASLSPLRGLGGEVEGASLIFQDMSQLRQAEAALSQSEERLRAAFEQAASCMALRAADPENPRWLRVNQRMCEVLGYTEAELLQLTSLDITPPEDQPAAVEHNRRLLAGNAPAYSRDKRYLRKDGTPIWVNLSLAMVRSEDGKPLHVMTVFEDITARKQAEAALAEAQAKLELAVASASVGFWELDVATGELSFSREWKTQLGYAEDELAGGMSEWERLCHADDVPRARAALQAALRDRRAGFDIEIRMRHRDGAYRWMLSRATVHRDRSGEPVRVVGGHTDITRQKQTEAQLARSTSFYAALSATNEAIARIREPEKLFKRVCQIAVEQTGLRLAWIGLADEDTSLVRPVAMAGPAAPYAVDITVSVDERSPAGQGPTGRAMRADRPQIVEDVERQDTVDYWRARASRYGIRSSAAFPLRRGGRVCGCLSLYAGEPHFFDAELVRLLGEMAADISFGLDGIDADTKRREAESRVRASESRYRMLVANFPGGAVLLFDRDLRCQIADGAALRAAGGDPQSLVGQSAARAFPDASRAVMEAYFKRALDGDVIEASVAAHGERQWAVQVLPVHDSEGRIAAGMLIGHDLTERRRAEEQLRLSALAIGNIADGVIITDADTRIVSVNKAFTVITGYAESEVLGRTPQLLRSGRQDEAFYADMRTKLEREGHWRGEIWNRRKNGEVYPEFLSVSALRDESGAITHYVGVFNDISQFKAYEEHLEYLAHHDPLTGLPNRTLLEDRVEMAIANAERKGNPVALLFVDLDRFKLINDTLGHAIGDELLIAVARRLSESVRGSDTVSRHGGDEFLVLLPDIHHADDAARIAEKLMDEASRPYSIGGHELATSLSIGIAVHPENGSHMADLLRNADAAMYSAKEHGRNRYQFYTQSMNVRARERLTLETDLRTAVERGQFHLVYQPQADLRSGRVVGVEALLRWLHPERGLVPPAAFIPVAEECGLIVKIGEWVLRAACAQNRRWRDSGMLDVPIAVNVSAIQFRRAQFARMVKDVLAETGLPAQRLELEVTESVVMDGRDAMEHTLHELHREGVRLTIDDFGTGYSSLSYLRHMPIQQLKIDQSFVRDLPQNKDAAVITQTIATLASSLDLTVVAEGVEREDQLRFLRATLCDKVQGYLLCEPLAPEALERWLAARSAEYA